MSVRLPESHRSEAGSAYWRENETFRAEIDPTRPKYYVLDMFPYPSGDGLHVGHPEGYTATDILARYKRMQRLQRAAPDGLGRLRPARRAVRHQDRHPPRDHDPAQHRATSGARSAPWGFSYDWSREIDTTDPGYVKWTQWIFQKLYEKGLAYEAEVPVNWCPALGTVLANEEVIDGKSERGGHPVERVPMRQWMLRITAYADRLLEDLDGSSTGRSHIKKMQREWIGRSEGARARFPLPDHDLRDRGLHDAAGHALRRHLHGAGARAPLVERHHHARAARRGRGVYVEQAARQAANGRAWRKPTRRPASSPGPMAPTQPGER